MKNIIRNSLFIIIPLFYFLIVTISSCSSTSQIAQQSSGAQLWGENCVRCHSSPSPESFSNSQWDVAVTHMRIRANLTEEETEKILEFLKSAN